MIDGNRQHAPATLRNREPIARVLRTLLPQTGLVLEVASGTGEHIVYLAGRFPGLTWQPSDISPDSLRSIESWAGQAELPNVLPPLALDAAGEDWAIDRADAVMCINMVHISAWSATVGLMAGAGRILAAGAPLYLYGPFRRAGYPLEPSNVAFDQQLRNSDSRWGLRDLEEVVACAADHELLEDAVIEMPANNLSAIFRKK
jgi:SAM-dependent methyltransferase